MRDEWVRTVRTSIQVLVTVSATVPLIVPAVGLSTTVGVGAAAVAVAAAITRVMQIPAIAELLNKYLRIPKP